MDRLFCKTLFISALLAVASYGCKSPVVESSETSMVDTLGFKMERKVVARRGDTIVQKLHYLKDKNSYFEVSFHSNGQKYMEGWIIDGARDGKWYSWYPNGVLWSSGNYDKGDRVGVSEAYYENGTIRLRQSYMNGIPDGTWTFFYPNGKIQMEVVYENGEKVSEKAY